MKTLRRIERDDLERAARFSAGVYSSRNVIFEPAYFAWAFERTLGEDRTGRHGAMLAELDGEIIGTFVAVEHAFNAFGKLHEGVWIHDWFTEQGHGPTGLQLALTQLRGRWFFGASGHGLQGLAVLRAAYAPSLYFELERLVGIVDPKAASELSFGRSEHTEPFLRTLRVKPPNASVELTSVEAFDEAYEVVWDEMRRELAFATHRSAGYMNWRYGEHPYFRYERARCRTEHGAAYFVWRNERIEGRETVVSRIVEAIGRPAAIIAGFPAAFRRMADAGAVFADFFGSNSTVNAALVAAGMLPAVTRPELDLARLFQPLENTVSKSLDFSAFFPSGMPGAAPFDYRRTYITKGDSNQDRPNPVQRAE